MSKYTNTAKSASASILKAGALLPFRRFAKTYDSVTGAAVNASIASQSLPAVVLPIGRDDRLPEGLVVAKARKLIVAGYGASFQLSPLDLTKFSGQYWEVKGSEPLQPDADGAVIFTVFVERVNLAAEDDAAFDSGQVIVIVPPDVPMAPG